MSNILHIDKEYQLWIQELSKRFRRSQIKAAVKVNQEMLAFYWDLGRDIVARDAENTYGKGFYANLSQDLRHAIPDTDGFSVTSLKYAKYFYALYSSLLPKNQNTINRPQLVDESLRTNLPQVGEILNEENRPQVVDDLIVQVTTRLQRDLFSIPWGHHRYIIDKCSSNPNKALFYVQQTIENGWSRDMLLNFLSTDLYERSGKALSNFQYTLPAEESDLAQEITRDPYNFAFTGITGKYNERKLKDALLHNIHAVPFGTRHRFCLYRQRI